MSQRNEIYKCNVCGNIIEVVHAGDGELVCCGQPMVLMSENTVDAAKEKHVPVITNADDPGVSAVQKSDMALGHLDLARFPSLIDGVVFQQHGNELIQLGQDGLRLIRSRLKGAEENVAMLVFVF